jgi:hypothetical protein
LAYALAQHYHLLPFHICVNFDHKFGLVVRLFCSNSDKRAKKVNHSPFSNNATARLLFCLFTTAMAGSPRVKPLLLRRDTWSEIDSPRTKDGQEMHLSTLLCSQASTGDLAGKPKYSLHDHACPLPFMSGIQQVLEGCEISQWT